jgi:hypothetical protein
MRTLQRLAEPVCQQSVGLLRRGLDEAGIATISITQVPAITELVRPSLACFVAYPFGLTLGAPGDADTHERVVRTVLSEAEQEHPAGSIVSMPFRWNDDLRARQLRKQAHLPENTLCGWKS